MWFDDEEVSGRRRYGGGRRRPSVLHVRGKGQSKRWSAPPWLWGWLLVPVAVAGTLFAAYHGVRAAGRALFSHNPHFTITRVDVRGGTPRAQKLIREYTRIGEGVNLFAFDIAAIRRSILVQAPRFRAVEITRVLPDAVRIDIFERVALARIGRDGVLVADAEGSLFTLGGDMPALPLVLGCTPNLQPGQTLEGLALAALQVLDVCDDPRMGLRIDAVRLAGDHVALDLVDGGKRREVALIWEGMGRRSAIARSNLVDKITGLRLTLDSPKGREMTSLDGRVSGSFAGR